MPLAELAGLSLLFLLAAASYSSVGFGGGSAYLALLTLFGTPIEQVAIIALACNVVVAGTGSWHFIRAGHLEPRLLAPLLPLSVAGAFAGGLIVMEPGILQLMTGIVLAAATLAMLFRREAEAHRGSRINRFAIAGLGGTLGMLSGMIGIGGGIFLAPALHLAGWSSAKQIATVASLFIVFNSIAALAGKSMAVDGLALHPSYLILLGAVLIGGQIGSRLGARRLSPTLVRRITAGIVGLAALNLLLGS